jgi:hypothetical protein
MPLLAASLTGHGGYGPASVGVSREGDRSDVPRLGQRWRPHDLYRLGELVGLRVHDRPIEGLAGGPLVAVEGW